MCTEYADVLERLIRRAELPVPYLELTLSRDRWDHRGFCFTDITDKYKSNAAGFEIAHTPGLIVINQAFVAHRYRGHGLGTLLAKLRVEAYYQLLAEEECARENLDIIARVAVRNGEEQHILEKLGWVKLTPTLWTLPKLRVKGDM